MTFVREQFLTAPAVALAPSNVLDVASVKDTDGFGWRQECAVWPNYNGLDTIVPTFICPDALVDKEFDEAPWASGFAFSVYGGVKCKLVGLDRVEQGRELERVFKANEAKGVELALLQTRFVESEIGSGAEGCDWDAPVNVTPAAVVSPSVGIALLEGYFGREYVGVPTLHIPRTVASYLAAKNEIVTEGGVFHTRLGSKVVNGAGYEPSTGPDGSTPAAGEYWIYATGEVTVERARLVHQDTVVIPGDGSQDLGGSGGGGHDDNTAISLVERSFRVIVDGPVVAVRVEIF